ncbi:hypothetical protein SEUCBS139899_001979 [Sporothrix eucalyptigena]
MNSTAPSTPTSPTSTVAPPPPHAHACTVCARRKVRCDKADPCFNCRKSSVACVYEAPGPSKPRPRKRAADAELLARLARYEELMRRNGVAYESATHRWVASGWETKIEETANGPVPFAQPLLREVPVTEAPVIPPVPLSVAGTPAAPTISDDIPESSEGTPAETPRLLDNERCLWQDLPVELKYPPMQALRAKDDPLLHPMPPLQSIMTEAAVGNAPPLSQLHPPPRHIFVLWQRFVDQVNPLTKIVHVPTLQPRVLEASADLESVPPSLSALLFSIYTLSMTSMTMQESETIFGENKIDLLMRYRVATLRALVAADFLVARDFEVLQAMVLYLVADPESELTGSLVGVAMRLGQRLGLHQAGSNTKLTVFDRELRIRVWWALCGVWARAGLTHPTALKTALLELGDVRLPLNVNDADLHPDMTEAPVPSVAPTEMLCVLVKYEFTNWVRTSPATTQTFENIVRGNPTDCPVEGKPGKKKADKDSPKSVEEDAVRRIEMVYDDKFLRRLDTRIPLHGLAQAMIRLALARMRFKLYHPRNLQPQSQPTHPFLTAPSACITIAPTGRLTTSKLFDTAVCMLDMVDVSQRSGFAWHIFTYMTSTFQMDAYIYVASELRRRATGERVAVAWRLLEALYDEHPEIISGQGQHRAFYAAFSDLTLDAWATREAALRKTGNDVTIPVFIQQLRDTKEQKREDALSTHPYEASAEELDMGWTCWEEFLRL